MKKICIILFAGLLVSAGLQAQEMYIEGGKVILDMTVATGMPADAITNAAKTWGTPSNTTGPLTNNTETGTINEKVFQKLEIALTDLGTTDWVAALNGCRAPSYNGGGWRLPTQRELMMIWIFSDALKDVLPAVGGTFLSSADYYWSATERSDLVAWVVDFAGYTTVNSSKKNLYRVRCVREIP
jgi:hypothetical protein